MEREEVFIYGGDNALPWLPEAQFIRQPTSGSVAPLKPSGLAIFPSVFVYSASFLLIRNLFPAPPVRAPFHDF